MKFLDYSQESAVFVSGWKLPVTLALGFARLTL